MFSSITTALNYINATIENHLSGPIQISVDYVGPSNYSASLSDKDTGIVLVEVFNCPGIDDALMRLACAIRDESDIGA